MKSVFKIPIPGLEPRRHAARAGTHRVLCFPQDGRAPCFYGADSLETLTDLLGMDPSTHVLVGARIERSRRSFPAAWVLPDSYPYVLEQPHHWDHFVANEIAVGEVTTEAVSLGVWVVQRAAPYKKVDRVSISCTTIYRAHDGQAWGYPVLSTGLGGLQAICDLAATVYGRQHTFVTGSRKFYGESTPRHTVEVEFAGGAVTECPPFARHESADAPAVVHPIQTADRLALTAISAEKSREIKDRWYSVCGNNFWELQAETTSYGLCYDRFSDGLQLTVTLGNSDELLAPGRIVPMAFPEVPGTWNPESFNVSWMMAFPSINQGGRAYRVFLEEIKEDMAFLEDDSYLLKERVAVLDNVVAEVEQACAAETVPSLPDIDALKVPLWPQQAHTLSLMLRREEPACSLERLLSTALHTSTDGKWEILGKYMSVQTRVPPRTTQCFETGMVDSFLMPTGSPGQWHGGVLVAPMGFGKTVLAFGLVAASERTGPTLVVAPPAVVGQWESMCRAMTSLRCMIYTKANAAAATRFATSDIVVTSYRMVEAAGDVRLLGQRWARVIYDESHVLKSHLLDSYKSLQTDVVWCMTATPYDLKHPDIWTQMEVLPSPYGISRHDFKKLLLVAPSRVATTWRESSETVACPMPDAVRAALDAADQAIQDGGWASDSALADGVRRRVVGGSLTFSVRPRFVDDENAAGPSRKRPMPETMYEDDQCALCLSDYDCPATLACGHVFCKLCIEPVLAGPVRLRKCPLCRAPASRHELWSVTDVQEHRHATGDPAEEQAPAPAAAAAFVPYRAQKACSLVHASAPDDKFLIFSQYDSTLQALRCELRERDIGFRVLSGRVAPAARGKAVEDFFNLPDCKVLVLSLGFANAGLNLTAANRIIFCEPPKSDRHRAQAVGRACRPPQSRDVLVTTLADPSTGL